MATANMFNGYPLFISLCLLLLVFVRPSVAFGAGNIASMSKIEGQNWRHGDIEDTLLTLLMTRFGSKKFSKLDVKRVYFGNWLRDYSQAVDVGTVKYVSAEAIRILLWILGFMSFGFGTGEFEVTTDRLGCYRPEEHIDNPKDYADNQDARQYDRRLRGPINERRELSIDERNGLKNYIASEDLGITTSAGHVRNLLRRCIQLARQSKRDGNDAEFYEALRLLGTATHCLEDYTAHSNYTELCLIEMGEHSVFPHVGRSTQIQLRGALEPVFPIVTGTFGGVDFLHSVMGELSDKSTQSEIQELEGAIDGSQNQQSVSMLKQLLNQLPSGLFGGENQAGKVDQLQANAAAAQMQNMHITPNQPEAFTQQVLLIQRQIYPVIEFHDQIMKGITEKIEQIPILPDLIEQLQDQVSVFVFSLIAPFILPLISQIKAELTTGSSEVIKSSREQQHIVFNNDDSSDPTHSMLSKDHFSNVLNEPAGKTASQILTWVIPQIVDCWDDERQDADRAINRIIEGVFHHPALRDQGQDGARDGRQIMFRTVESWWRQQSPREQNDLRDKLSREGVRSGRNHKEGVRDSGHGCGHPLKMAATGGAAGNQLGNIISAAAGGAMGGLQPGGQQSQLGQAAGEAVGGGLLGSIVGGVIGGVGGTLLGSAFEGQNTDHKTYQQQGYGRDGSVTQSYVETAHRPQGYGGQEERYGQAQYARTEFAQGGQREEYKRYEQGPQGEGSFGYEKRVETRPTGQGGYQRTEERRYEHSGGQWSSETMTQSTDRYGQTYPAETEYRINSNSRRTNGGDDDDEDREKKERKRREKQEKDRRKHDDDSDEDKRYKRRSGSASRREDSDEEKYRYGRRKDDSGDEKQKYGRHQNDSDDDRRRHGHHKKDSDDEKSHQRRSGGHGHHQHESDDDGKPKRHSRDNFEGQSDFNRQSSYENRDEDEDNSRRQRRGSSRYDQNSNTFHDNRYEDRPSQGQRYGRSERQGYEASRYGEEDYREHQTNEFGDQGYKGHERQSQQSYDQQGEYGERSRYNRGSEYGYDGEEEGRGSYGYK